MYAIPRSVLWGLSLLLLSVGSAFSQSAAPGTSATPAAAADGAETVAARRDGLITPADLKAWNSVRTSVLSNDGRWFAYVVAASESDATLIYRGTAASAAEKRVSVGNPGNIYGAGSAAPREGGSSGALAISGDSKWLGYIVAPPRPPERGAANGGRGATPAAQAQAARPPAASPRAPGDSAPAPADTVGNSARQAPAEAAPPTSEKFVLVNLLTGEEKSFERIRRFSFNADRPGWVALTGYGTPEAPAGGAAGRGGTTPAAGPAQGQGTGPAAAPLLLYNLETGELFNMGLVAEYAFDESGQWLAYTMSTPDRVGNGVQLRNMRTNVVRSIENERLLYRHLAWVDSSRALSVMRGRIQDNGGDTVFSVVAYRRFGANGPAERLLFDSETADGFPSGYKLASERAPRYARDFSAVFVGIREAVRRPAGGRGGAAAQAGAPGMGGSVNQAPGGGNNDSLPNLILWHARDNRLQSQQIVQEQQERSINYLSAYRFDTKRFVQLADDDLRNVTVTTGDRYAYGVDTRPYEHAASYSGRNYQDIYAVDVATGERRLLMKEKPSGSMSSSPDGRRVLYWGADGHWWTLDLVTGDTANITRNVPTTFFTTDGGYNDAYPRVAGPGSWSRDGAYAVINDGWDYWQVPVRPGSGAAVNLTGDGRSAQIRYQRLYNFPNGRVIVPQPGIDLSRPLYFGTYGEWTKKEGLARVDVRRPGAQHIVSDDARFNVFKARDADVYIFTRQTFTEYPNYWAFGAGFRDPHPLTDINPQMKDLAWSSGARLVDYTNDKGERLQGALYLPANYEPGKQYPLLVTIYERRSQNLHGFVSPSDTRAPDPTLYTNRGYAVLDPDIVYYVNDPGMSAVWAVVPAVKAAIATGIVDPDRVGLWGHSWGGYQTAFLVTQTDIFRAAIAGAPLTDMISMYSSVYWNTGGTNQAIFESSQGRFKGNFIDNYEAYIRNSPAFHAHKQNTPLIILHNDKDGAVDFNQGITHFNTLRQLGKEVILLQYVGENHGLARPVNQRDYAWRMSEWFDHYLKDAPAPDWMKNGIPRLQLEQHLVERLQQQRQQGAAPDSPGQGEGPPDPPPVSGNE